MTDQQRSSAWHVVGLGQDLAAQAVLPGFAGDTQMAIWRDSALTVHAFDAVCPHRGMRLSYGFVRNNRLACPYHGWQYADDGHCAYIPAHPELPASRSICATVYPCHERYGLIWSSSVPMDDTPPQIDALDDAQLLAVRTIIVNRSYDAVHSALLGTYKDAANYHPFALGISAVDSLLDHNVVVAMQVIGSDKTGLHLVINDNGGSKATIDAQGHKTVARWGVRLRAHLEQSLTVNSR